MTEEKTNTDELISVIVPIYKVEKYLDRCIQSIVNQTYRNLEIILVDDGSPDNCPKICDEWKQRDNRIKVIHKANEGLSEARNTGIDASMGRYLAFIDSDDYVDVQFIEYLYRMIRESGARISAVEAELVYDGDALSCEDADFCGIEVYSGERAMQGLFDKYCDYAWNKLYDRGLFDTIRYPKGKKMEDTGTMYKLLEASHYIAYSPKKLYYYYQRADSIRYRAGKQLHIDKYEMHMERYEYLKERYPGLQIIYTSILFIILEAYPYLNAEQRKKAYAEYRYIRRREDLKEAVNQEFRKSNLQNRARNLLFMLNRTIYRNVFLMLKR